MNAREEFTLAGRAFDLFTLAEREAALTRFAALRYPSITDRFVEAVHWVIQRGGDPVGRDDSTDGGTSQLSGSTTR